jgi:hypothetical protein
VLFFWFIREVGAEERAVSPPSPNLCPHLNHGARPAGWRGLDEALPAAFEGLLVFVGFWGARALRGLRKAVAAFVPHCATALQMTRLRHGANSECGMRSCRFRVVSPPCANRQACEKWQLHP